MVALAVCGEETLKSPSHQTGNETVVHFLQEDSDLTRSVKVDLPTNEQSIMSEITKLQPENERLEL